MPETPCGRFKHGTLDLALAHPMVFTDGMVRIQFDSHGFELKSLTDEPVRFSVEDGEFRVHSEKTFSIRAALFAAIFPWPFPVEDLHLLEFTLAPDLHLASNAVRIAFRMMHKTRLAGLPNGTMYSSNGRLKQTPDGTSSFWTQVDGCQVESRVNGVQFFQNYSKGPVTFEQLFAFCQILQSKRPRDPEPQIAKEPSRKYLRLVQSAPPASFSPLASAASAAPVVSAESPGPSRTLLMSREALEQVEADHRFRQDSTFPNPHSLIGRHRNRLRWEFGSNYHVARPVPKFNPVTSPPFLDRDVEPGEEWARMQDFPVWISSLGRRFDESTYRIKKYDFNPHQLIRIQGKTYLLMMLMSEAFLEPRKGRDILFYDRMQRFEASELKWKDIRHW